MIESALVKYDTRYVFVCTTKSFQSLSAAGTGLIVQNVNTNFFQSEFWYNAPMIYVTYIISH